MLVNGKKLIMKTRLLIIILAIIAMIFSVTFTYISYQMSVCHVDPAFFHNPRMNGVVNCLEYLTNPDPNLPDLKPSIDYDARLVDLAILEIILIAGGACCILFFTTRRMNKLPFSICLIIAGSSLLMIFTFLLPVFIDNRFMSTHSNIPIIILYDGWILLGVGIWQTLSHRFAMVRKK
jgi:hypothetical protein